MNVEKTLNIWASACSRGNLPWFLYQETLLCAVGYQTFPETLTYPQVAVFSEDLSRLTNSVFPALPDDWTLDATQLARGNHQLLLRRNGADPVLAICILWGVRGKEDAANLDCKIASLVQPVGKKTRWHKIRTLLPLYSDAVRQTWENRIVKIAARVYEKLPMLADAAVNDAPFYWDHPTNKTPFLLPREWFSSAVTCACDGREYPIFSGYHQYLTAVFADYETGLHDEIGCGLTPEEKLALQTHQEKSFQALRFVQEVAQEFGLRYYLLAGSVLGTIRHGGFIPWDDDIDIGIRIEDLEEFESVIRQQLPKRLPRGFALMQSGANNPYPRMFSKICYEGRCCIDLWPLVPTYTNGFKATYLWYFGKLITKSHYEHIGHTVTKFRKPAKLINLFLNDRIVMFLARRNERRYAHKNAPAYINLYSIYLRPKETIRREWLDTQATALFNGLEVPVVGCTEAYLTHLYGNYMAKPAPWKRASRHFDRFYPTESNT